MYRYEPYIKDFLVGQGELSLEKTGVFTIDAANTSTESGEPFIHFAFDKNAKTSDALIAFIAEKEHKNKSLIASDIESFIDEMRQFINIGKSYSIEGLGQLHLNKTGRYEFVQETPSEVKEADISKRKRAEHAGAQVINNTRQSSQKKLGFLVAVIVAIILAGVGWMGYYYFFKKDTGTPLAVTSDSTRTPAVTLTDTALKAKPVDSTALHAAANATDSLAYRYVFEFTSSSARAYTRLKKLRDFRDPVGLDSVKTDTAMLYKLYLFKKSLAADTAHIKDSIQVYLKKPVTIEFNK